MKKTIAKHILGLTGVGILWFIVNQWLSENYTPPTEIKGRTYNGLPIYKIDWKTDLNSDGGLLLLEMLGGYLAVCLIYWAVKTIWFDKDKD